MGFGGCALLNWMFIWQEDFFLGLFTTDSAVVEFGKTRMHIALATQSIAASYELSGSAMRGMGKSVEPTLITIFGTCMLRIAWVYAVSPHWPGFGHLVTVYPISWIATGIMMLTLYAVHWKTVCRKAAMCHTACQTAA